MVDQGEGSAARNETYSVCTKRGFSGELLVLDTHVNGRFSSVWAKHAVRLDQGKQWCEAVSLQYMCSINTRQMKAEEGIYWPTGPADGVVRV